MTHMWMSSKHYVQKSDPFFLQDLCVSNEVLEENQKRYEINWKNLWNHELIMYDSILKNQPSL